MNQMVKDNNKNNNNNSSNSMVFGRWPQTKIFNSLSLIHCVFRAADYHKFIKRFFEKLLLLLFLHCLNKINPDYISMALRWLSVLIVMPNYSKILFAILFIANCAADRHFGWNDS